MVVNRKQPAAPVPLVQSRSTSQQPIVMRKKQSKSTTFTNSNGINSHKPDNAPSTNPQPRCTARLQSRKKSPRGRLIFWSLTLFALYSFLFCSPYTTTPQKSNSHFICRAQTNYKTYILEPFILPPLTHSLSFTHSLAKPYISQANTHIELYLAPVKQVTSTVKPYVIQTATTTKRVWIGTLVPFYTNTLKPYYQSAIVPRYNFYLRPYLLPLVAHLKRYYAYYISKPIRIQCNHIQLHFSTLYATHIHSYISHLQPYIHRFTSTVHTTWLSSVEFYGTYIQPTLLSTWIRAQPHLSFAFNQAKDISANAAAGTAKQLKGLAKKVGTQRRTYVDPHIRKIWDKVEENATANTAKMTMASPAPADISLEEETAESTVTASLVTDSATQSFKESDTPIDVPVLKEDVLYLAGSNELEKVQYLVGGNAADATTSGTVEPEPKQTEIAQAEAATKLNNEETLNESATSASAQEESSAESSVKPCLDDATNPIPNVGAAAGGVIGVAASSPHSTTAVEDDLDDFLRDIGIDTTTSPYPTPTEAGEAAASLLSASASASAQEAESSRLASIASKRLAITTRHATFESDLQSSILTSTSQVIQQLNEMREAKKEELIGMIEGTEGEGLVVGLTSSADKLLKGLEVYLKKCEGRSGTWKRGVADIKNNGGDKGEDESDIQKRTRLAKDEQTRLEIVIEKVEIKFLDVVQKLQEQVTGWYLGGIEREQEEISRITRKIRHIAEQAQANLGLDYAWLEDVTYMDWQRYHDLMRAFENFEKTTNAIQDGTSLDPPSPPNPIKPVINALQEELQTVVLGFHVALKSVKDTIPELFNIYAPIPVPGRDVAGAGVDEEDKKVRIQPIDPDADGENEKEKTRQTEGFDPSKVIIGKSKEQIEQALEGVPSVVKHEEL